MIRATWLCFLFCATSCTVSLSDGTFACDTTEDCPAGWICESGRCFRSTRSDGSADSGTDAAEFDAAFDSALDSTTDTPMPDAGSDDASLDAPCSFDSCDDENPCTDDVCQPSGCVFAPNTAPCDDSSFCNGLDTCNAGVCTPSGIDPCGGGTVCDESTARCVGCREDSDCPPTSATAWGSCSGFTSACDDTGTQSRTVTTFTCAGMTCVPNNTTESRACSRSTNGNTCGATTCGSYGSCDYTSDCDETANRSRTCTDQTCSGGVCRATNRTETDSCSRDTDGNSCSDGEFCNGAETCSGGTCRNNPSPCPGPCDDVANSCIVTTCGPGIGGRDCKPSTLLSEDTRASQSACHSHCESFSNASCCEYRSSNGLCRAYTDVDFDDGDSNESFAACTDQVRTCTMSANTTCSGTRLTTIVASLTDCRDRICPYARNTTCCVHTSFGSSCALYTGTPISGSSITTGGSCTP